MLFGADRYEQAARAYHRGIERRARAGAPVGRVRSVASVFVSRIDALVAERLGPDATDGSVAIAKARWIYRRALAKTPAVRDVGYVEALALPDTIVTVPEKTLLAFAEHGAQRPTDGAADDGLLTKAAHDLEGIGRDLEVAGLRAFSDAYAEVIDHITRYLAGDRRPEAA